MPFTTTLDERLKGAAETAEERHALIAELTQYMAVTQINLAQLAQMTGKGESTLRMFMGNRYHNISRNDTRMRAALRLFLDANPVTPAETASGRLYETENVATLRHWFERCLHPRGKRGRMACVYAGPGSQKTFVTEHLVAGLNAAEIARGEARARAFHIYCSQGESPLSLAHKMLRAAGIPAGATIQRCLATLRFALRRNRTLFVFDEAQHLAVPCLEIIRELNDLPPHFGVMLLGSHRLREFFAVNAAQMEQWHSRITEAIELPGIAKETIAGIVREELRGLADFTTKKGQSALEALLADCLVKDIYSGRQNQHYYSVRKVFMAIEGIREEAEAQKGVAAA